jgi:hypothetical protein
LGADFFPGFWIIVHNEDPDYFWIFHESLPTIISMMVLKTKPPPSEKSFRPREQTPSTSLEMTG